ncbi:MAG: hypothetical protein LYZ69_02425 [Nitrososphaerales archaeon]|nr:hypothetical protein [Nitrososphaerales archaeon]
MDSEFLALSAVFILLGVAGIVLFYGPMTPAGDSCYCLIPSPEPGAAQGTSSILLALGVLFFPMGLMKGGLPSLMRGPGAAPKPAPGGQAYTPVQLASGGLLSLGIILVVVGVDLVLVPGYLVLGSTAVTAAGGVLAVLGALAMYFGSKRPKSSQQ